MDVQEELALVKSAQAGQQSAIALLWDDSTPRLFGYLKKTLRDVPLAEDLLQQTWLKAITALPNFRPRGVRFRAWLFAIAVNECKMHWRKNGREVLVDDTPILDRAARPQPDATDKIFLDTILNKLENDDRDILCLRYISELSFNEIAAVLAITPISARVRVHRALKKARLYIEDTI